MGHERIPIQNIEDWIRNQERSAVQQNRRRVPRTASDLLGPGFGPRSTQILDWSQDETAFNGFFWSPIGAINSPDSSVEWIGITITDDEAANGVQKIWTTTDTPPREAVRRWTSSDGITRIFTAWSYDTGWKITGITPLSGATIVNQCYKLRGGAVEVAVRLSLGSAIDNPGGSSIPSTPLLQVPPEITPFGLPEGRWLNLSAGPVGPLAGWHIDSSGVISLHAADTAVDLITGFQMHVGGMYLL